jgi:hypothetical protein
MTHPVTKKLLLELCDKQEKLIDNLRKENEGLKDKLDDLNGYYKTAMEERCNDDRQHCTCYPALKKRIEELMKDDNQKENDILRKRIEGLEMADKDTVFIKHIQNHLKAGELVICKICGKTANEIIERETPQGEK